MDDPGAASADRATNRWLQSALVDLPAAGTWQIEVDCRQGNDCQQARFTMDVAEPLPRWLALWPWYSWPAGVVLLFALHGRLTQRDAARRAREAI